MWKRGNTAPVLAVKRICPTRSGRVFFKNEHCFPLGCANFTMSQAKLAPMFPNRGILVNWETEVGEVVLPRRFELPTSPLPRECSTPELRQHVRVIYKRTAANHKRNICDLQENICI